MKINMEDKIIGGFNYEFLRGISLEHVGAAEYGECMETISRVKEDDFTSWIIEWAELADRVSKYAEKELNSDNEKVAQDAYLRASNYYRMAVFYANHTDPRHTELWKHSKECFQKMITLMDNPIESIEIEFEDAKLPAYFISGGEGKRQTLIAVGGFDSTLEELYCWIGANAAQYGWNCLIFEGPGQWGALKLNPGLIFRPDYEKPVKAVVDYALTRPDVDKDKLALIGYSLGGYLAPRSAAFDPRIKACIANTLILDFGKIAKASLNDLPKTHAIDSISNFLMQLDTPSRWAFQHSQWALDIETPQEWIEAYTPFNLNGLEENFKNPMLFLFSDDDIVRNTEIVRELLEFMNSLDCDRTVHLFTKEEGASSHCQMGGLSYAQAVIFQWLDQIFCGKKQEIKPDPAASKAFVNVFKKYGGEVAEKNAQKLLDNAYLI
jgi:pimeloyl-ACP methyl ester carboxylesterase